MRLHDEIYLKSNRYNNPKESHKLLAKILKKRLKTKKNYNLLDIGCSNGELIYYLAKKFKNLKFTGIDNRNDLIKKAKSKLGKSINLKTLDYNKKNNFNNKYDVIVCYGVICILDNIKTFFQNIKKNSNKNTKIFIFDNLNEYDFDIFVKYVDLNMKKKVFQAGWNIWSLKTIKKYMDNKKIKKHSFNINFDVNNNKKDLMRSWTIKIKKKRYFTNATNIIQRQILLEIN
jgi:cyclopropane fatty-acyl-phospholipid synthase-like methyltransferase